MTRSFRPASLGEALAVLATERAVPVAGCTDLMVVDHAAQRRHEAVLDVTRIPELQGIEREAGWLSIGAATTFSELHANDDVRERLPILAQVAATIGGWQIQNRATLGGNIANASPAGDSLPVLLALDAELAVAGTDGERRLPYTDVHRGYRETALAPGELIVRVRIPLPGRTTVQRFRKVGTRAAQAIAKVGAAFVAELEDGRLRAVRVAASSVAPTPVRLAAAEAACEGRPPDDDTARAAAAAARADVAPIDDVRSTAAYRSFVLGRVVRRMIRSAGPAKVDPR